MRRLDVFLSFAISVGAAMTAASAQSIQFVSPCDLVHDPAKFANQLVSVRATVLIAFEDFTLETPGCGDGKEDHPIWLMYGGDEPTPVPSTVNHTSRPVGMVLKIDGRRISLTHDASLDLFRERLAAERTSFNGKACGDACRLYRVTATLSGVFFAGRNEGLPGYGHLGCCHLLVIERVSDVAARRTPVPAGGQFDCSEETWDLESDKVLSHQEQARTCNGFADCSRKLFDEIATVARQKGDEITRSDDDHFYPFLDQAVWTSPDLLKTYSLETRFRDSIHRTGPLDGITVTRATCKPVSPPLPLDTSIGCRSFHSDFATTAKTASQIKDYTQRAHDDSQTGTPDRAAERALEEATKHWGIIPRHGVKFDSCQKPMDFEGTRFSECQWLDSEGMERFSVQVRKFASLRHHRNWNAVPWILSSGSGFVCVAER
jgi:hypothetical protein